MIWSYRSTFQGVWRFWIYWRLEDCWNSDRACIHALLLLKESELLDMKHLSLLFIPILVVTLTAAWGRRSGHLKIWFSIPFRSVSFFFITVFFLRILGCDGLLRVCCEGGVVWRRGGCHLRLLSLSVVKLLVRGMIGCVLLLGATTSEEVSQQLRNNKVGRW
jgi:hypothetical protein